MSAQITFSTLMADITTLKNENSTNSNNLAMTKAVDASQDVKLQRLVTEVVAQEHKVA